MPVSHWESTKAVRLPALDSLVYRSNLLGKDETVVNFGGGNTSMKILETAAAGNEGPVIWVKGSGCDLATMKSSNFTALRLKQILPLYQRADMTDEEMVDELGQCMLDTRHPRSSVETLLHAFLPFKHIDHTHPNAIMSICCVANGEEIGRRIYGEQMVWVPYVRPGFGLSKLIADKVRANPKAEVVLMGGHGLVTWGESSEDCYRRTLAQIQRAEDFVNERLKSLGTHLFGGPTHAALPPEQRRNTAAELMPLIKQSLTGPVDLALDFTDTDDVLRFVDSAQGARLSQTGAASPDHLIHTKRAPLFVDWSPAGADRAKLADATRSGIARYLREYDAYFKKYRNENTKLAEPVLRVVLIPGVGAITTGKNPNMARVCGNILRRAIAVWAGATALGQYVGLNEKESFEVEYWALEIFRVSKQERDQNR